jgi:hypothetical protein
LGGLAVRNWPFETLAAVVLACTVAFGLVLIEVLARV